jgi:hypothetical protein
MMWYAHRCTIYDNLVKDEIVREIVPRKIEIPRVDVKMPEPSRSAEDVAEGRKPTTEARETPPGAGPVTVVPQPLHGEVPQEPTSTPKPEQPATEQPALERPKRSPEAQEALKKLRRKWLRNAHNADDVS